MKIKNIILCACALLFCFSVKAQQGKDGPANITATSTVNIYTPLIANAAVGATSITVASTAGISAGDLIYIIQMQGALVKDSVYEWGNPNSDVVGDTSFGKIKLYNGAGNNEFAQVTSVSGNMITIDCALKNNYSDTTYPHPGNTQVIRVPRYTTLTLSGAGQITCPFWDGHTGGIVVIEVQGNTNIGSGTSINVAGKGFRGGAVFNSTGFSAINTGNSFGSSSSNNGAHKGESIAGDTNVYKKLNFINSYFNSYSENTPLSTCKGNVANGGGGGNANNCGGGGGSNGGVIGSWNGMGNADVSTANNIAAWNQESTTPVNGSFRPTTSSGGGRGGYAYSVNNADPTTNGPNSVAVWGSGDGRHNDGGWGGTPLDYSTGKVFLGGGGGAGDSNDGNGTSGGNGGGIVYLLSYGTVTGAGQIIADGALALSTNWKASTFDEALAQGDDGAGGGGGGGAVFINSTGSITLTNTLAISAQGGGGGNYFMKNTVNNHNFGPGGGGGGGYIAITNTVTGGVNVNGGANGIVAGASLGSTNASKIATKFPPNGATAGGAGTISTILTPDFYLTATNYTTCASSSLSLSVTVNGTAPSGLSVNWYTVATGSTVVFTGNPYAITAPASAGTYTYYAGTCPGTYRIPIIVTVTSSSGPLLSVSATRTVTCSGLGDTLSVSGATSYTWSANAGSVNTNTAIVAPTSNTTYTVTGSTTGACAGTSTASISITVNTVPSITITPTSNTLCSGSSDLLTATSSATSYTWSANAGSATTNTVSVSPTSTSSYTVTGANGSCASTQTISISVTATPTVSITASNTVICNGSSSTFTANGATTYFWNTGATTNTITVSPTSNTTYTVTGNNGACAASQTIAITTDAGPVKADSAVVSASCSQPNGDYVINSITGGVAPYQINFNGTGFVAISSFPDTIKNLLGNTYPVIIKDGFGCAYTTTATIGNTSGISKIDSVIANASCVPANSGTITINSVTGGTAPYQASINGGSFNPIVSFPYSFINLTAGTYTVQVKDNTNCPHLSIITVGTSGGITSASITPQPDTCSKQVGTITIVGVSGGTTPYSYALNGGSYQTANTFTALPAGTDTVKVKDNSGCIYFTTVTVGGTSGPTAAGLTTTQDTCAKGVGTIKVVSVTGGTTPYSYALNNGGYQIANTFTTLYAGTDTVKIKDNSGCTYTLTTSVTNTNVVVTPTITASGPTTFCQGGSVVLTASSSSSYTWSTGATTQTISVNSAGTYSVITKSISGCTAFADTLITVIPTPTLVPNNSSLTICVGSFAGLMVNGATSYSWAPSTGLSTTSGSVTVASPSVTTTYTISGSTGTCTASPVAITVSVNPMPTVSVTPNATIVCSGNSATLTAGGTATGYTWSPSTGLSTASGSIVAANPTTLTQYTVTGSLNGCTTTATAVVATSTLQADFVPTPDTGNAPLNVEFTNTSNGGTSFTWNYGNGSSTTTSSNLPTGSTYSTTGTYTVTLTASDASGCVSTYTTTINVLQSYSITIPNVFSPNGDGINDDFEVKATGITSLNCDIYDRWGLKLYTYNSVSGNWDGTNKGAKEPDGTYFYVILTTDVKGDNHKYNGFIQLIR